MLIIKKDNYHVSIFIASFLVDVTNIQSAFTCLKSTLGTPEQCVKSVQS